MNFQPRGISAIHAPSSYKSEIEAAEALLKDKPTWNGVTAEAVARMRLQNRFKTGLDIARYTAAQMRADMAAYDADPTKYTQSLGCWHGFIAQQKLISIKKHNGGKTDRRYIYLSGWMIAALRSEFGPLPDQSMHEKTSVPALIEEIYTFLRQADSRELNDLFRQLDKAREAGDKAKETAIIDQIDNFQTHVVPIIADIDAGFGNAEATYLLAKKMIEAGACALQIENQVSDEKQCGHQDGKVTVPHDVFIAKVRAIRHAFLEMGVEDGIIVTRTDSLGAGLTQQIAVSHQPGDIGDQYNSFLDCEEVDASKIGNGDVIISRNGKLLRPKRLPSNLYQFRPGTGADRCVLDCITSLQNGADLLWIETEKPHIEQIASMVDRIREVVPNAKLAYNNSPSFNWTLNFRWQVYDAWKEEGKDVSKYNRAELMKAEYDETPLAIEADARIRTFQADSAKRAGIFHHLITLPTYHTAALSTDNLAREYFGDQGMLGYVKNVQRQEIRQGIACVKHQNMAGSDIGDDHKEYFAGDAALKAGGEHNTMNQFS
ncbi:isocitrate lyase [Rhodopseudomonas palustris]|jgi:isocitrate lyase|uniref:Isocitrate lyase n=1 Tax=Rhodopseudomonas palustris TaxID=1076 RepID=A0AAX3DWR7_RHOPL|nr:MULTISPECIES: isocitrate lyase [Rhodopseudomonas]AVT78417.1 isocitrate lyase [Rhodopseudomonas palustris]AVT83255.1 isocitrate lyase [Rhodopseudomonas palustris]NEV79360.1 isocitrate lyase [Rhodopseudomonas sp. BR0C11]UYO39296.1 isocitrate lyase [Rhodopseudomonas palustris]UYO44016.1 isocitrate lyase [Rhodopseudomonas palustris]